MTKNCYYTYFPDEITTKLPYEPVKRRYILSLFQILYNSIQNNIYDMIKGYNIPTKIPEPYLKISSSSTLNTFLHN